MATTAVFQRLINPDRHYTADEASDAGVREFMKLFFGKLWFLIYLPVLRWWTYRSHEDLINILIENHLAVTREEAERLISEIATGEEIGNSCTNACFFLYTTTNMNGKVMYRMQFFTSD